MLVLVPALLALPLGASPNDEGADDDEPAPIARALRGLELRGLGPALTSGRIGDLAVDPENRARYYAAAASGGVWKTENAGASWTPVFDGQSSYSIGVVELDPRNPHTVWVGTGENNSQRSVSWGDGVYRSRDGGESWERLGLEESEHIGGLWIDPRDSDRVFVAAQGPLWRAGGDRGLYRTVDGGASWERVLAVDEWTGANEIWADPRDPDTLYCSTWQRGRRVWTLLNGGPGSGVWKSTDGGDTWREVNKGLPKVDLGRIGLCVSPADPDVLYAIVEAAAGKSGVFRSVNRGETWEKRSGYATSSPQYYNELVADPADVDRVYVLDTFLHVSEDGGRTFTRVPNDDRHVDDHALWIDPADTDYLLVGCDGGVYESFDRGAHWTYKANLPITQFYRVAVDDSEPFYHVYGGTQDNNTLGGPVRTLSPAGIANEDWFVTVGGDGFESQVDPTDPNIVYSQWQYGGLVRHDRRSGETVDIKPRAGVSGEALRWNWDAPLLISPHRPTRLYFAANVLFRSDDRGNSWTRISGELSRGLDRNTLPVMGRVWEDGAVAKHHATSDYGNAVAFTESPLVEGLLYVGTDDGVVNVSEDGGATWRRVESFPGVYELAYVAELEASRHDPDTVYATFDDHKSGDFTPYVFKSIDRGRTWASIAGNLEAPHVAWSIAEDHVDPSLLFLGTEYGAWVTLDGGGEWHRLKKGLPPIAVRDVEIQRRESDLVLATFGRGFYVLDDYSPLRELGAGVLDADAHLFAVGDAWSYVQTSRLGGRGRGSQGAGHFTADNPPYGAVFTYHLKDELDTARERRREADEERREADQPAIVPTLDELRAEEAEAEPEVWLVVRDADGRVVRRLAGPRDRGLHRVAWDLRLPATTPVRLGRGDDDDGEDDRPRPGRGPRALPGTYSVALVAIRNGVATRLTEARSFDVVPLELATLPVADRAAAFGFQRDVAEVRRAVRAAVSVLGETRARVEHLERAVQDTPGADAGWLSELSAIDDRLRALDVTLNGDRVLRDRDEASPPSVREAVEGVARNSTASSSAPTETDRARLADARAAFEPLYAELRAIVETDLPALEAKLEAAGAPWTPGRALPALR